ncbi:unnamed protein product [Amoebophrya sp. A25]|nr:unnamed protein product [Amoebophrya sp. A25]|eukprot:GSA25T00014051001.1
MAMQNLSGAQSKALEDLGKIKGYSATGPIYAWSPCILQGGVFTLLGGQTPIERLQPVLHSTTRCIIALCYLRPSLAKWILTRDGCEKAIAFCSSLLVGDPKPVDMAAKYEALAQKLNFVIDDVMELTSLKVQEITDLPAATCELMMEGCSHVMKSEKRIADTKRQEELRKRKKDEEEAEKEAQRKLKAAKKEEEREAKEEKKAAEKKALKEKVKQLLKDQQAGGETNVNAITGGAIVNSADAKKTDNNNNAANSSNAGMPEASNALSLLGMMAGAASSDDEDDSSSDSSSESDSLDFFQMVQYQADAMKVEHGGKGFNTMQAMQTVGVKVDEVLPPWTNPSYWESKTHRSLTRKRSSCRRRPKASKPT